MDRLFGFIRKEAFWIILVILAASVYFGISLSRLRYNDDITAFFPEKSREVALFKEVGKKFGGLDVALVGLEFDDLFKLHNLRLVRQISKQIQTIEGVGSVTSLTEVRDFEEREIGEETGSIIQDLVGELPDSMTSEDLEHLRRRVMSKDHIVGSLVSRKGDAVLIICKLDSSFGLGKLATSIRQVVTSSVAGRQDVKVYYGGAPFVSANISEGTQKDLKRLSPWVMLAVVVIIFTSFRSIVAALLALVALALSLVVTLGLMPIIELPMDLVSTSLPMVLASIASAYGIHLLARYFRLIRLNPEITRKDAVEQTVKQVSVPIICAGITTIVGFASFLVMDIRPLRNFGFMMSVGIVISLLISILFITAVLVKLKVGRPGRGESGDRIGEALAMVAIRIASRPQIVLPMGIVVIVLSIFYISKITTETTIKSYFAEESEPVQADRFMVEKFGGSLFLQLYVQGDIKSPLVLKEMQRLEDRLAGIDGVTEVRSITQAVTLASAALTGREEIPPHREQVASLSYLLEDDPAIFYLVDRDWKGALIQVRVKGFDTKQAKVVSQTIRQYIDDSVRKRLHGVSLLAVTNPEEAARMVAEARGIAAEGIRLAVANLLGRHVETTEARRVLDEVLDKKGGICDEALRREIDSRLRARLLEDELIFIDEGMGWDNLVTETCELVVSGKLDEQSLYDLLMRYATAEEREGELAAVAAFQKEGKTDAITGFRKGVKIILAEVTDGRGLWIARMIAESLVSENLRDAKQEKYKKFLDRIVQELSFVGTGEVILASPGNSQHALKESKNISIELTGYPLLYQRMNESVLKNQVKSTIVALIIIFVVMAILFKSLLIGMIGISPAVLTLLLVFGGLGFSGVPMDMGVSMVSIIALGASVDYPIHFFWKYREVALLGYERAMAETMKATGRAIALNALEVMAGFGIMVLGVVIPVKKAGGLIALTLFISAAATLFLMPVLIKVFHKRVERKLIPGRQGKQ